MNKVQNFIKHKFNWPNNSVMAEFTTRDGKRDGQFQVYLPNGQVSTISEFRDDKLNGKVSTYYENGQLCEECRYKNDRKNGLEKEYDHSGSLKNIKFFQNGFDVSESSIGSLAILFACLTENLKRKKNPTIVVN